MTRSVVFILIFSFLSLSIFAQSSCGEKDFDCRFEYYITSYKSSEADFENSFEAGKSSDKEFKIASYSCFDIAPSRDKDSEKTSLETVSYLKGRLSRFNTEESLNVEFKKLYSEFASLCDWSGPSVQSLTEIIFNNWMATNSKNSEHIVDSNQIKNESVRSENQNTKAVEEK